MLFMTPNPPTKALVALSLFSAARAAVVGSAAQTFVGIGGSGAWWPIDVYKFPEAQKQKISDLLFSDSGLGLSHYRWNVGGGGVGVGNPSRAPEMFWTGPGQYDWSKDPQGVYFMKEANKRGSIITAFANSAPAPLTSSNASCDGQFNAGTGGVYGTYLADVIQHFIGEGINIKYVSPMNEPDNNFGDIPCGQEGMQVWPTDRAEVVTGLWDALNARGLASKVGITADETTWVSIATAEDFLWVNSVKDKLVALAHHTYDFPANWVYSLYLTQTSGYNVQTWMTEVCCSLGQADGTGRGWSQGYDPTITNALMWAGLVFQSMVYANEARYDFWTLASSAIGCDPSTNATCPSTPNSQGWTDGLIYYDSNFASNHNYELYLTKHFWTYKHFGNYVKPGMKRLNVGSKSSSDSANLDYVLVSSSDSAYNVILMNPTNGATTLTLQFPTDACAQKAFRTSEKEDFASVNKAAVQSDGKTWSLAVAPMSLTTYTFSKSKC